MVGNDTQALAQIMQRGEIQLAIAPLQHFNRIEQVVFQPVHQLVIERIDVPGHTERAIIDVATRTTGDLAEFGGRQLAMVLAIELARARQRHMVDVQVKTHADRIGGDDVIDVTGLIQRHLGIAGARRQRADDDGSATLLAADQFGDLVHFTGGKRDDGCTCRQPRNLLLARVRELRQART